MTYALTANPDLVVRALDGAVIPVDPSTPDGAAYQAWLAAGNVPAPAPVAPSGPPTVVQIVSSNSAALNGAYSLSADARALITSEVVFIATTKQLGAAKFTNGETTEHWPDASGAMHLFTVDDFTAFAMAVAQFFDAVTMAEQAGSTAWPAQPVTIP